MNCDYNPIYRICRNCGREMERSQVRQCMAASSAHERVADRERTLALREARDLIKSNAVSTWKSGQIERSDGLTDLLVEFDRRFPEVLE